MNLFKKKVKDVVEKSSSVSYEGLTDAVVDIISGLNNALTRGEGLDVAMQSFVNAGYDANDVMVAGQKVRSTVDGTQQTQADAQETVNGEQLTVNDSKAVKVKVKKKFKFNLEGEIFGLKKSFALILGVVSLILLIGALILGLNFGRWFR